jgi:hypothetical protein
MSVDATVPRRARRRSILAALVAVVALGSVGGALALRGHGDQLRPSNPKTTYGLLLEPQDKSSVTLASIYLRHPGKTIEIISVTPLTSPNIQTLGTFTVWPQDYPTNRLLVGPGFPAPELKARHPAIGAKIPASETGRIPSDGGEPFPVTVGLGFRLGSGDLGVINGVQVVYKIDGKTTSELFREAVIVCAPPNRCAPAKGQTQDQFEDAALAQFGLLPKD